jgi:hypothetical protein
LALMVTLEAASMGAALTLPAAEEGRRTDRSADTCPSYPACSSRTGSMKSSTTPSSSSTSVPLACSRSSSGRSYGRPRSGRSSVSVAGDFCHLTVPSGRGIHRLHFGLGCSFLPRSAIPGIAPRSPSYTMAPDDQTSAQHDSLLRGRRSLTLLSRVHLPIYTPPISPLAHFPTNWLPSFPRFLLFPC